MRESIVCLYFLVVEFPRNAREQKKKKKESKQASKRRERKYINAGGGLKCT